MKCRIVIVIAGAALALAAPSSAPARRTSPTSPCSSWSRIPPGGSTDVGARIVAAIAEKLSGQPMIVVNKGGAGGQVGWTEMVRQKPDGYYIGYINLPATNTVILDPERKAIFTEKDFTPIINQVLDPGVIWVRADSPYKTVHDLIAAAKKAPSTIRTGDHRHPLGRSPRHPDDARRRRPARSSGSCISMAARTQLKEIMAGNIDAAYDNVGSIATRVKTGEVRALAVLDDVRSKFMPDVPTMKELGYPTVMSNSTRGIAGPKGMPAPVVSKLQEVLRKAMQDPDHVSKLENQGLGIKIMIGEDYAQVFRRDARQGEEIHRVGEEPAGAVRSRYSAATAWPGCAASPRRSGRPRCSSSAVVSAVKAAASPCSRNTAVYWRSGSCSTRPEPEQAT